MFVFVVSLFGIVRTVPLRIGRLDSLRDHQSIVAWNYMLTSFLLSATKSCIENV